MFEIGKQAMRKNHERFENLVRGEGKTTIELITEFNSMTARILLMCALGEDVTDQIVDFWKDGKKIKLTLGNALRLTFSCLISRMTYPKVVFFPFLARYYFF